jgi:hypothetical protein
VRRRYGSNDGNAFESNEEGAYPDWAWCGRLAQSATSDLMESIGIDDRKLVLMDGLVGDEELR